MRCIYENTNFESNSQLNNLEVLITSGCVVSTKIQILKAIHNQHLFCPICTRVVLYLRKYKFWKQFTTFLLNLPFFRLLCCIYENTNFESNSQQRHPASLFRLSCVVSTKIQILKAIHNTKEQETQMSVVVLYLRKYKFWKQFTTAELITENHTTLCCIYENTNFESNSQHTGLSGNELFSCVVSTKIQILKAIHNTRTVHAFSFFVVLYLRKYKFWKQFTTSPLSTITPPALCCIYENTNFESNSQLKNSWTTPKVSCVVSTKIQILKAIHNCRLCCTLVAIVVLYLRKYKFWKQFTTVTNIIRNFYGLCCIYENTNFESNSQRIVQWLFQKFSCVVSTKIQILKAIHNFDALKRKTAKVVLYLRKYKFWKQFTTVKPSEVPEKLLCCIYENTNFESNSQLFRLHKVFEICCVVSTKIQILKAIHNFY